MEAIEQADYQYLSIGELSRLIQEKKVSPTEVVKGCLERIERLNPTLNAFITITAEQALQEANEAEAEIKSGNWKGHLHGIPVAVKDMFDTAGIKTTAAFEHFKDRVPEKDVAFPADNTFFCNYYGLPAISVPCGFGKNGLPLGLQIVGEQWSEGKVLDIANRYQNATKRHLQHPVIAK